MHAHTHTHTRAYMHADYSIQMLLFYTCTGVVVEITDYDQFVIEQVDDSRYIQVCSILINVTLLTNHPLHQASVHVFGERSRRLPLCIGDHVIALYNGQ